MTEQEAIKRILSQDYSSGSLAYHSLQPDVTRIELADGSIVARLGSALIGDPVSPNDSLTEFAETLAENLPEVSVFHIEQNTAQALRQRGYRIHSLGIESHIPLPFSLQGREKADLRRALNRARKAGVDVMELSGRRYEQFAAQIATLNRQWLSQRRHFKREFRFLARPYVERYQPGERRFIALQNGKVVGIAVYDPVCQAGKRIGYFEALMRCDATSAPGVRDMLTVTAMRAFAAEDAGIRWVSLGLSPFAPPHSSTQAPARYSLTRWTVSMFFRWGNSIFNCRGLAFHKERYRGDAVPIFFATKSRFPLGVLYNACRQSNIDPLQPAKTYLQILVKFARLTMKQIRSAPRFLRRIRVELVHSNHK